MDQTSVINYIINSDHSQPMVIVIYIPAYVKTDNFILAINSFNIKNIKIEYFLNLHFTCRSIQITALLKDLYLFVDLLSLTLKHKQLLKYDIINQNDFCQVISIFELRRYLFKILKNKECSVNQFKLDNYTLSRLYQINQQLSFINFIEQYCSDLISLNKDKINVTWQMCDAEDDHKRWCLRNNKVS